MSQQARKLAVPALTFLFALVLAFVVNPALGLLGFMMAGEPTGGSTPCEIKIFRDEPFFSKVLDDWPQAGVFPRSPKYVFGEERPITIEVKLTSTQTTVRVRVTNVSLAGTGLPNTIDIECDQVSNGVYRSRTAGEDEVLFLSDHTQERPNGDLIHVREEDILQFVVVDPNLPDCKIDVMVDRGEAAATTATGEPNAIILAGFTGSANAFVLGARAYDLDTTFWFNVGLAISNPAFGAFVLNAGSEDTSDNSRPNWQADVLYTGSHGWHDGILRSHDNGDLFNPDNFSTLKKPGTPDHSDNPADYYIDRRVATGNPKFGDSGKEWGSDIDWSIIFACHILEDLPMDVGSVVNGRFVKDPAPNGTITAAQRWHRAFQGPRVLHGICGFKSTGRGSTITAVMQQWTKLVKQGVSIPEAWRQAVRAKDPQGVPAVLYQPLNWVDTIDSMQRDPAPGSVPSYWSSGMTVPEPKPKGLTPGNKKRIQGGKVSPTGDVLQGILPLGGGAEPVLHNPLKTLLNGQCRVFVTLPAHSGTFPRLNLTRAEALKPGGIFALNADGVWAFDHATPYSVPDANTSTTSAVVAAVKKSLTDNFVTVPTLANQGVFEGQARVGGAASTIKSRYEVVLEQRYKTLTVFDSEIYALATPSGTVDACDAVFYTLAPTGALQPLINGTQAATAAASDFLTRFPGQPCDVTLALAFYGFPVAQAGGVKEVRPVWAIEFGMGKVVYTLDAVTGAILTVEQ